MKIFNRNSLVTKLKRSQGSFLDNFQPLPMWKARNKMFFNEVILIIYLLDGKDKTL